MDFLASKNETYKTSIYVCKYSFGKYKMVGR